MKLFIGNIANNALGKAFQIWKSIAGSILSSGKAATITVNEPFVLWSTNDSLGPTLPYNTIGFNNSGGAGGGVSPAMRYILKL